MTIKIYIVILTLYLLTNIIDAAIGKPSISALRDINLTDRRRGERFDILQRNACIDFSVVSTPEQLSINNKLFQLRAGKQTKSQSLISTIKSQAVTLAKASKVQYDDMLPVTKTYISIAILCTLAGVVGLPAPALFSLDISRFYEIWRPITTVCYFGSPSISMVNSLYFLLRYGQILEHMNGSAQYAWFLAVQTAVLTILGYVFGFNAMSSSMITAIIYINSRINPMEQMMFQFGLLIKSWQLPYVMMAFDCLIQRSLSSAWPHLLGIFSGHVYHFFTDLWPKIEGHPTGMMEMPRWFGALMTSWLPLVKRHNVIDYRANAQGSAQASTPPLSSSGVGGGGGGENTDLSGGDSSGIRPLNRYIDRKTLSYSRNRFKKAKGKKLGGR